MTLRHLNGAAMYLCYKLFIELTSILILSHWNGKERQWFDLQTNNPRLHASTASAVVLNHTLSSPRRFPPELPLSPTSTKLPMLSTVILF